MAYPRMGHLRNPRASRIRWPKTTLNFCGVRLRSTVLEYLSIVVSERDEPMIKSDNASSKLSTFGVAPSFSAVKRWESRYSG